MPLILWFGIGINVNLSREQFPQDIQEIATSLAVETGREFSQLELIISLYENLEKCYKKLLQKGFGPIKEKWLELAPMIGQTVAVIFKDEAIEGKATGLDDDGSLILLTEGSKEIKISAGQRDDNKTGKEMIMQMKKRREMKINTTVPFIPKP